MDFIREHYGAVWLLLSAVAIALFVVVQSVDTSPGLNNVNTKSPNRYFRAWLELPFFVGVAYTATFRAEYRKGLITDVRMRLRNDLFRVATDNEWTGREGRDARLREYIDNPEKGPTWFPKYITVSEVQDFYQRAAREGLPYVHVERTETVVELSTSFEAPPPAFEEADRYAFAPEVMPHPGFFDREVLPHLSDVIDAYRASTLPAVRYAIHPVSEALVNTAFIEIRNELDEVIQQWMHEFDIHGHVRSMQSHVDNLGVQARFEQVLSDPERFQAEIELCSAYYLYHMRRWAEAVAVATAVVDRLTRDTLFARLNADIAELVWSSYRSRFKDVFLKILPGLGIPKISEVDSDLWQDYLRARDYRGAKIHGGSVRRFDRAEEDLVGTHLRAIYGMARWLTATNGREWVLDVEENGKLLRVF
jgi:hypothetical protein